MAAEKSGYVRPTVGGWLRPLLIAPWLSTYGAVTAYAFLGPEIPYTPRWVAWGVGMLAGSIIAFVYVLALTLIDLALLAIRVRQLPTGKGAWLAAFLSPVAFLASYTVLRPWNYWKGGPWAVVAALAIPPLVTAIATRVAFGVKLEKTKK